MNKGISRREFIFRSTTALTALPLVGLLGNQLFQTDDELPNIILIYTDDQGYADIGVYGAEGFETPNLDALANNGIQFKNYYSAAPTCTPSRAALLTGCYPVRVGLPFVVGPKGPDWTKGKENIGLNTKEMTIAKLLKQKNYATCCIGKWHLGDMKEFLPLRQGFDYYFGLPYSHDMNKQTDPKYPDLPLMENEKVIELNPDLSQLTKRYTEKTLSFIKKNRINPFFIYLAHSMPHVPLFASEKFKGKSKKGVYGDVIEEIDWSVGEIVKSLKEQSLYDNTIIVFTSDNGPWLIYGNHAGSAGNLREGKFTTFEGGQREPCIISWPRKIPKGLVSDKLFSSIDFLPTFAAITGTKLPLNKIDGKDALLLWENKPGAEKFDEVLYFYAEYDLQAVRWKNWKLHFPHEYNSVKVLGKDGKQGIGIEKNIELSLFDLSTDPEEETNLVNKHPDIVNKLKEMAKIFDEELKKDARPCGRVDVK
jgi:arylsulfatase A-like enzyme